MKNSKKDSKSVVFNVIIVILVVAFLILLSVIVSTIGRKKRVYDPMSDLRFSLKIGNYYQIYNSVGNYRQRDYSGNKEYEKYEAIADYYSKSLSYFPYKYMNSEKANECLNEMSSLREKMGDLCFAADDIDKIFEEYRQ